MRRKNVTSYGTLASIIVIIFFFSSDLIAQDPLQKKGSINFGFEAGIQFTNISDPYMPVAKSGVGYNAGPFFEYFLSETVNFRAGIQFDNRAFMLENMAPRLVGDSGYVGLSSHYDVQQNFKVNYLTIPISLLYTRGGKKFNLFIQGTVYYSFLVNSVQTGHRDVYISEEDAPHYYFEDFPEFSNPGNYSLENEVQNFNSGDIGINMFIGGIYYIKPGLGISLSPGFTFAFSNVWEDPMRIATWSTLYKVTAGLVYSIK